MNSVAGEVRRSIGVHVHPPRVAPASPHPVPDPPIRLQRGDARGNVIAMRIAVAVVLASAVAVSAAGCLISPVIPIGGGKSAKQNQRELLNKQVPNPLSTAHTWKGDVRVAKLRVWADDEYRAQNVRWQHGVDEQLDDANQVLTPMLGIRLEAEYHAWQHHAPGSSLSDAVHSLAEQDAGDDVVWVVGLTSALSLVSATFDQLGIAIVGDHHVVVRGHADLEERKRFERAFPSTSAEERELVLDARRRHKTTTVLIHELAHSLGALHETEADRAMSPNYSQRAGAISDRNRELMLITLEDRLKPAIARDPRGTAQLLIAALEIEGGGWDAEDRAQLVASLRAQVGAHDVAGVATEVPAPIQAQYDHAEQLLASGNPGDARATLEPLLAAYPSHVQLRVLDCKIALARGGTKDAKAIATCERAASVSPEVGPAVAIATARLAAGDAAGATAILVSAEARISKLAPDKAGAAWLTLAQQYRGLGALTWAEAAVARSGAAAGADHGISSWVATTRARYGIPRDGARYKLAPADEAAAVTAVRGVVAFVNANQFDAAAKAARAAERRWPALPGLLAARCDLELRRGALAAARQYCNHAIARGGSSWGLYLSGVLELRAGSPAGTAAGIQRLRAAIELDPDLGQAWRTLGKALDRARATAELEQLRQDYRAKFGSSMPR
jgi:tetratricopeptide (TPR) repeat protein